MVKTKDIAIGAGGLEVDYRAGQIGHYVANATTAMFLQSWPGQPAPPLVTRFCVILQV